MKRIVLHWTAGTHKVNNLDREHYHFIVAGDGTVEVGKHPVSANDNTSDGAYAQHTKGSNTGSIGVALAAMAGAVERPFSTGVYPITTAQVDAMVALCARLAKQYGIAVTRETILTHAEVQPTLGIKQNGKWDITWLPGFHSARDPVQTGDFIRAHISAAISPRVAPPPAPPAIEIPAPGFWAWLMQLFGKGR